MSQYEDMRRIAFVLLVLVLSGCRSSRMPYLGHWMGKFDVKSNDSKMPSDALALQGYLQLYQTDDRFVMQLNNKVQSLDLGGTWKVVKPGRIELDFNKFSIEQPPLEKMLPLKTPFIEPEELRKAYAHNLILDLGPGKNELTGLLVKVGPLVGTHSFTRAS